MRKILLIFICIVILCSSTSCTYYEHQSQDFTSLFDSFDKSENLILLTCFELVVNGAHYNLDDIRYNGQLCHIVFLEEDGFYSYVYTQDDLSVEFLYTRYETFEVTSLGSEILPAKIIHAFWGEDCFWFRMDDPSTEEFQQMYYSWNIHTKQSTIVDSDCISNDFESSEDSNRSTRYVFSYTSKLFGSYLEITDIQSGITKKVDHSVLKRFEEGQKIRKLNASTRFNISHVFEDNGTLYFATLLGVNPLGDPCYCYVYTWDFETEACEFYTFVYFDSYQEWVTDMYIK